jgi:hypothetical protein
MSAGRAGDGDWPRAQRGCSQRHRDLQEDRRRRHRSTAQALCRRASPAPPPLGLHRQGTRGRGMASLSTQMTPAEASLALYTHAQEGSQFTQLPTSPSRGYPIWRHRIGRSVSLTMAPRIILRALDHPALHPFEPQPREVHNQQCYGSLRSGRGGSLQVLRTGRGFEPPGKLSTTSS